MKDKRKTKSTVCELDIFSLPPQTDRQTERANQEMEQYLWLYINY